MKTPPTSTNPSSILYTFAASVPAAVEATGGRVQANAEARAKNKTIEARVMRSLLLGSVAQGANVESTVHIGSRIRSVDVERRCRNSAGVTVLSLSELSRGTRVPIMG